MTGTEITPHTPPLTPTSLSQNGDSNLQVAQVNNLNLTMPGSRSPLVFSTDYYNLFVSNFIDLDCTVGSYTVAEDRIFESTAARIKERYKNLDNDNLEELKAFPAIFAHENQSYAVAGENQKAKIGIVHNIRFVTTGVRVEYQLLDEIPQQALNELLDEFDLEGGKNSFNELNRTHWAVKNVFLVRELAKADLISAKLALTLLGDLRR